MNGAPETIDGRGVLKGHLKPPHLGETPGAIGVLAENVPGHAVPNLVLDKAQRLIQHD